MTTKIPGGKITGAIALTMEAQSAMEIGDAVQVTGPYECDAADGGSYVLGWVSVANKKRAGSAYPVANVPGEVTVEARLYNVNKVTAGAGGIAAGSLVKPDATGKKYINAADGDVGICGIALTTAAANGAADVGFI